MNHTSAPNKLGSSDKRGFQPRSSSSDKRGFQPPSYLKHICTLLLLLATLLLSSTTHAAVTSVGEINVAGEDRGVVPATSTVPLVVTLVVDRSLAEPGEEIKIIEIMMPTGFLTETAYFTGISRDGNPIVARAVVSGGNVLRIELADVIVDFQNSLYEITFDAQTPNTLILEAVFTVRLRNLQDAPIGEFIRPGQADGKLNNDDFTLQVIPNVPPEVVTGFTAEADTAGENDVTLRWQKSEDPDVNGYLIYMDKEEPIQVVDRSATTYRHVNVLPGTHTYQITAYKTLYLQSERSTTQTVTVSADTAPPEPPTLLTVNTASEGVEVIWKPSPSRDVTRYQIFEGLTLLGEIDERKTEYRLIDDRPLSIGSFTYSVIASDEAGNESTPIEDTLRIFENPYPNPFTPLSPDTDFNRVIFPARALADATGEFTVLIFNINGMLIRTLTAPPGQTELVWDGRNEAGDIGESGIYLYQLQVGESYKTGTLILAK